MRTSCFVMSLFVVIAVAALATNQPASTSRITLKPVPGTLGVEIQFPGVEGTLSTTLPELVNDATRRLIYTDTNLKSVEWRSGKDGSLHSEWKQAGLGAYELHATPEKDGVALRWSITNLSSAPWPDAAGNICMRSRALPQFFDPVGDRIFFRSGGRWVAARDAGPVGSIWYLSPGRQPLPLMKPHLDNGSYRISGFHPDEAIIAVRSKDSRFVYAQAWPRSRYLLANIHANYVCTEAPPAFGDVEAGKTSEVTGKIYFLKGTLEDLADAYRKDLRTGKIAIRQK